MRQIMQVARIPTGHMIFTMKHIIYSEYELHRRDLFSLEDRDFMV